MLSRLVPQQICSVVINFSQLYKGRKNLFKSKQYNFSGLGNIIKRLGNNLSLVVTSKNILMRIWGGSFHVLCEVHQCLTLTDVLAVLVRSNFRCCCVLDMLIGCLTLYPHTPCMYRYSPPPHHLYSVYLVSSLRSVRLGFKCRPAAMLTNTLVSRYYANARGPPNATRWRQLSFVSCFP